jgi:hypothetical protein
MEAVQALILFSGIAKTDNEPRGVINDGNEIGSS